MKEINFSLFPEFALAFLSIVVFLQVHSLEITNVAPEEAVKHFAQALRESNYDTLSQLCIPSIRHTAIRQLEENQEVIKKYLQGPVVRSEKFKS